MQLLKQTLQPSLFIPLPLSHLSTACFNPLNTVSVWGKVTASAVQPDFFFSLATEGNHCIIKTMKAVTRRAVSPGLYIYTLKSLSTIGAIHNCCHSPLSVIAFSDIENLQYHTLSDNRVQTDSAMSPCHYSILQELLYCFYVVSKWPSVRLHSPQLH